MKLTAVITPDMLPSGGAMFMAHCPELDVASQGETPDVALSNLKEALEGVLAVADDAEIGRRLRQGANVTTVEVSPLRIAA